MRTLLIASLVGMMIGGILGMSIIRTAEGIASKIVLDEIICNGYSYEIEIPEGYDKEEYAGWICNNILTVK